MTKEDTSRRRFNRWAIPALAAPVLATIVNLSLGLPASSWQTWAFPAACLIIAISVALTPTAPSQKKPSKKVLIGIAVAAVALVAAAAATAFAIHGAKTGDESKEIASGFQQVVNTGSGCQRLTEAERLEPTPCDSGDATYVTVSSPRSASECPKVDKTYQISDNQAACLNLNWKDNQCIATSPTGDVATACDRQREGHQIERPVKIVMDSTGLDQCDTGGRVNEFRNYVVCTEIMHP